MRIFRIALFLASFLFLFLSPYPTPAFPIYNQDYTIHIGSVTPVSGSMESQDQGHTITFQAAGTPSGICEENSKILRLGSIPPLIHLFQTPETGDANGSGIIDIVDALITSREYLGLQVPRTLVFHPESADVNVSGSVDTEDAIEIGEMALGF